ncbi:MAG: bifunctional tRNA (5-methylaminomethyl-2-thiouridine)(34)-methyltransferase MnmD/FAD-dependent 5-carboxymethylaminomethyl-2-thiouridine(34) oxidoreductase MnmC [Halioglobus sp.]
MKRENTPLRALDTAVIDWREGETPASQAYNDIYYDSANGLAESDYCFLQGNQLPARWVDHDARDFCIAETGFGTGLNFLLTWRQWQQQPHSPARLHFISCERHPLAHADLERALHRWTELAPLAQALCENYPPPLPGWHRLHFDDGAVQLDLYLGDAQDMLRELARRTPACIDAWYLDGFAPAKNPALWQAELFHDAAALSRPRATAATFTAAGDVRRALTEAGFKVTKVPGFGRKRESLRAQIGAAIPLQDIHKLPPDDTPWDLPDTDTADVRLAPHRASDDPADKVLVIGGGLAGCWTAHALARRGVAVTLLESGAIAGAASGNDQGILYTRLSHKHSALTDFALHSYLYASRRYAAMFASGQLQPTVDGALSGQLQLQDEGEELQRLQQTLAGLPTLASVLSCSKATQQLGMAPSSGGIWFPGSGWLRPAAVCAALLSHPLIECRQQTSSLTLQHRDRRWHAVDAGGEAVASASCAVLATGTSTVQHAQLDWLPLRSIRGQTSHLRASNESAKLRATVCGEGYIAPAREGEHCVGASFNLDATCDGLNATDHADNLRKAAHALPSLRKELEVLDCTALQGRVGFRCATPDYLPVVGQVPDYHAFIERYSALRDNARRPITRRGPYHSGLYVSTGHGSRGLTSTPLAAEVIAANICAQPAPLEGALCRAIAPGRFIIRDLARKRV